jgi:uridine kinase
MYKTFLILSLWIFSTLFSKEATVVGIAGGTGCGKTTLARKIQEAFPGKTVLISQDSYYKDLSHLTLEERASVNFDHPDSLDFPLLAGHLKALKCGQSIEKPLYDFRVHSRAERMEAVGPNRLIIVEGILLFAMPDIRDQFDLKIFVDTDDDIRLLRRVERDIQERGRSFTSVKEQYLNTVKPMHEAFVQPSKKYADVIVPHGGENSMALSVILSKLITELQDN